MTDGSNVELELDDIQGNILRAYRMPCARYLFVRFTGAEGARRFLRALIPELTRAQPWAHKPRSTLNVALTYAGLEALGLPEAALATFPEELRQGMVQRAAQLGDIGASAPDRWDDGYRRATVHAALILHAEHPEALAARRAAVLDAAAASGGVALEFEEAAEALPGSREHFGFADAPSDPIVRGRTPGQPDPPYAVSPGNILLGYPDDAGAVAERPHPPELRTNGTYLVIRKLEQDVPAFRAFVRAHAALSGGDEELFAAKLMGRFRSGAPLAITPDRDDPAAAGRNDFGYADDPLGAKCPAQAHIRRANPRDARPAADRTAVGVHQIIRRSLPYGPWLPERAPDDGARRGLFFTAYGASIATGFELVQGQWLNGGNVCGALSHVQDPITGAGGEEATFTFPVPGPTGPASRTVFGVPRFVTTRGGYYLFVPGIRALARMSAERSPAEPAPPPPSGELLAQYDALAAKIRDPAALERTRAAHVTAWLLDRANQARPTFAQAWAELRRSRPIFSTPLGVFVSKFEDVRDVLRDDEAFSVSEYGRRMALTTGPFFLGFDGERHGPEAALARLCVRREDLGRVRSLARSLAEAHIAEAACAGRPPDPGQIADRVLLGIAGHYYGVPGPSDRFLWSCQLMSVYIFVPHVSAHVAETATRLGAEAQVYLDHLIAARERALARGEPAPDDVLGRLLALRAQGSLGVDHTLIRRTIAGIVSGSLVPPAGLFRNAFAWLTERLPADDLEDLRAAAARGDTERVARAMIEAARFQPFPPVLFRTAARDHVLAAGTPRATRIPAGARVIVSTGSAMMDDEVIDRPDDFSLDRPSWQYLLFGHGRHECLGRFLTGPILGEIAAALLCAA